MAARQGPKVALVTGGGSGIGLATVEGLARKGWRVALAGRAARRLDEAALELRADVGAGPDDLLCIQADQGDPESVRRMIDRTTEHFGRLDALVNNAGMGKVLPVEQHDLKTIRETFDVNAIGPAYAIHLAWPIFARQKSGVIVNVSSYAALDPFPGFFAYAATKAAMNLMALSCAKEGEAVGVRAFSVAPGAVETELLRSAFDESVVPAEMCMKPADVAKVIVECIEGERDASNGRTIYVKKMDGRIEERLV